MSSKRGLFVLLLTFVLALLGSPVLAGEADIVLPDLSKVQFSAFGGMSGISIMYFGLLVCIVGLIFAIYQYKQTGNLPAHKSMLDVSNIIWETCKTYLAQQGKFLIILWVLIAICMVYYFMGLQSTHLRQHGGHPFLLHPRHPRLLRRRLVRHPDQHQGQLADRLCLPERQAGGRGQASPCTPA